MIARGEFVEWADVFGQLYGTSTTQLRAAQEAGQDILLDIDVQGHRQVRRRLPEAVSVFILPPSFQELERRLRQRHSDSPEVISEGSKLPEGKSPTGPSTITWLSMTASRWLCGHSGQS